MATTIEAKIVDPNESLFEGEIVSCNARSVLGEIGILANHQPCLLLLAPSPLEVVTEGGERHSFVVYSGFLEYSNNSLVVLCDDVEPVENKDEAFERLSARGLNTTQAPTLLAPPAEEE